MAKSRPSLGGIFRLKGKNDSKVQLTGMNSYGNQNSVSSPKGDTRFTQKFTQFGNYKPKIFSGQDNVKPSASNDTESRNSSSEHYIIPTFSDRTSDNTNDTGHVAKDSNMKPKDNFMLIGDKDKPLILGNDDLSLDGSELPDELPGDEYKVDSEVNESTSDVQESVCVNEEASDIEKIEAKEGNEMDKTDVEEVDTNPSLDSSTPAKVDKSPVLPSESDGVRTEVPYIPPPDYDEEVLTIDMPEEDDWHEPQPSEMRGVSSRRMYRVYQGDDFGQYLQEEDSIYQTPLARSARREVKRKPTREQKRNSSKSITGTITRAIFGFNNNSFEEKQKRRTIHNVSYENSKIGESNGISKGAHSSRTEGRYHRANGVHSPNNHRHSHYEQFLNSRHTASGSLESTSDSDFEAGNDDMSMHNEDSGSHYLTTGTYASPNKYIKKNGIWEKLTLRFRRRSHGEVGTVN